MKRAAQSMAGRVMEMVQRWDKRDKNKSEGKKELKERTKERMTDKEKSKRRGEIWNKREEIEKRERRRKKPFSSNKRRRRFTLDVVSVFCCFELDRGGSNLVSVWLKRALW